MKEYDRTYGTLAGYYIGDFYNTMNAREKKQVTLKEYALVVKTYLAVFFRDLHYGFDKPQYFFLGGLIRLTTCLWKDRWRIKPHWYLLPNKNLIYVSLRFEVRHTYDLFYKLRKWMEENHDVSELPRERRIWIKNLKTRKHFNK